MKTVWMLCLLLAKIAVADGSANVREAAVLRLTDQAVWAKIAVEAKDGDVRKVAVGKLTDQAVLAKIAVEDKDSDVRKAAVKKVTDQAVLAKIAVEDKWPDVREAAVLRLTDQAVLAKIAVEDEDGDVRKVAVEKLTDQAVLAKIAVEDKEADVRHAAVHNQNMKDRTVLLNVAKADASVWVRSQAMIRLGDEEYIPELIRMLNSDGNLSMANDYLFCGRKELDAAARAWAKSHGCTWVLGGHSGPRWGEGK